MIGVNIDVIDSLIKKNNMYLQAFNTDARKLLGSMNELTQCYSGKSLEYLFREPLNEMIKIQSISKLIQNYSTILSGAKASYQTQDQIVKQQVDHINAQF